MSLTQKLLNVVIEEEVFIEQLEVFIVHNKDSYVCKLKKALYGLKQASRSLYERIDNYLLSLGFEKNDADPNLYFQRSDNNFLILVLYVDDLFLIGDDRIIIKC